ncbi:MAG: hypothetical protein NT165_01230 [Candidatus Falkowbacteria bacterium]|nr:hypothetical protein [Candidatus Falkowbacteria bacterium]
MEENTELARKILKAKETAEANKAMFICAMFKEIGNYKNVLVTLPSEHDVHFKLIPENKVVTLDHPEEVTTIPSYLRRGDNFSGTWLTRNVYNFKGNSGPQVVDIVVIEKTNHFSDGGKALILNIFCKPLPKEADERIPAKWKLKIGTPKGDFKILGTADKFISFEEINQK